MNKRLISLSALLLPLLALAQMAVGGWELYTPFNGVSDIVATPDKVYYLSGDAGNANLFSFDYKNDESYAYTVGNKLNDTDIQLIKYNADKGYLAVAYASGSIDIIKDNGSVVHLPDIKDAPLSLKKDITYIGFDAAHDNLFVCTSFGLVRYNDEKFEVVETGMYNTPVDLIGVVGDYLMLRNNNTLKFIKRDQFISRMANFEIMPMQDVVDIRPLTGNKALVLTCPVLEFGSGRELHVVEFDFDNKSYTTIGETLGTMTSFHDAKNKYTVSSYTNMAVLDKTTGAAKWVKAPGAAQHLTVTWDENDRVWVGDNTGVSSYKVDGYTNGLANIGATLNEGIIPSDLTINHIKQMYATNSGDIYLADFGPSRHIPTSAVNTVNVIAADGNIYDVTADLSGLGLASSRVNSLMKAQNYLAISPDEEGVFWGGAPSWGGRGLYKVRDGKAVYFLGWEDHAGSDVDSWIPLDLKFDKNGNLWVLSYLSTGGVNKTFMKLPASKVKNDVIKPTDWVGKSTADVTTENDGRMTLCTKSNAIIVVDSRYGGHMITYNTRGTDNVEDDIYLDYSSLTDQDGKVFEATRFRCSVEDHDGHVWVGTDNGIFEITNPEEFSTVPASRINRLKVPRNDGTNFADYLLDARIVTGIAVDGINRKWVSTIGSGVYLISADGREILDNFTTDNSALPTNDVYSVICDPTSNKVYFGTIIGLVAYNSTSSPAADNYDNVYAYPNPVRPDYTGWITVTGLMDKSLVKIADAAGNVFYTGRSEGGMITWDGCNSDGNRVKTGVYFVFASQNDNGSSGAVAKILVVN